MIELDALRYPIGRFSHEGPISATQRDEWVGAIAALPGQLRSAVSPLDDAQLDTPYRPGGWTLRQVVHHVGDSHMNSLVRFKWALTEEDPLIKPYDEVRWAELGDYEHFDIPSSLDFLSLLHARWTTLLRSLTAAQWNRRFRHPVDGVIPLGRAAGLYAWHGRHHLAHITHTIERHGWG